MIRRIVRYVFRVIAMFRLRYCIRKEFLDYTPNGDYWDVCGKRTRNVLLLKLVRDRIKSGWVESLFAADADGNDVECDSDAAVSFTLHGAIRRVLMEVYGDTRLEHAFINTLSVLANTDRDRVESLEQWNARVSQERVVSLLDTAIADYDLWLWS